MDQHASQIAVAALADAEQLLLASRGILPWHDTDPSSEISSPAKGCPVADGGHCGGRDQRAKAGDLTQSPAEHILVADALDLVRDCLDVTVQLLPLLPQALEQPTHARVQVLFGIFNDRGQILV